MMSYTPFLQLLAMTLGYTCFVEGVPTAWAQEDTAQLIRIFEDPDDFFSQEFFNGVNPKFIGLAFPPGGHTLLVGEQAVGSGNVVVVEPPDSNSAEVSQTGFPISDPINTAFDSVAKGSKGQGIFRLFLFEAGELIAIRAKANDVLDPATSKRFDGRLLGVNDPQGMTLDPSTESLFILDGAGPGIVRIRASMGRNFDGPTAVAEGRISLIPLPSDLGGLRGLAFDPASGRLFVFSPSAQLLYGLTVRGEMVAAVKLPGFQPKALQGMVFAPTLDQTDDPSVFALYIAASSGPNRGVSEWRLGAR